MTPTVQDKKRLVVLGGGFGGLNLIRRLQERQEVHDKLEITLIDMKDYYENVLAAARFVVLPDFHSKMIGKYTDYLDYAKFVQGYVTNVSHNPQEVTIMSDGQEKIVSYDYLVVCLGTSYPIFKPEATKATERGEQIQQLSSQIKKAEHVMIVGGRGVGAEVAGEIVSVFPEKKVTLVHSRAKLMDMWPDEAVEILNQFMTKYKITNSRVVSSSGNQHVLSNGTIIEADLKIDAMGGKPNSSAFVSNFASSLSPDGFMKVNENQNLLGHNNIYVIGDICDVPQTRNALMVKLQVPLVEDNILAAIHSTPIYTLDLGGISYSYPYHLALGAEYGIGINAYSGVAVGSKEEGDHMTTTYHKIVTMVVDRKKKANHRKQHQ